MRAGEWGGLGGAGRAEDEIVGWHYQHNKHEFEQTPGDSKRQGSLASCSSWGCKELVLTVTEQLASKEMLCNWVNGDIRKPINCSWLSLKKKKKKA